MRAILIGAGLVAAALLSRGVAAQDDWPSFHHDNANSGWTTSDGPETGELRWEYDTDDSVESSPTIVDGKVYFGCEDGLVRCLDATTGDYVWGYNTASQIWYSAPTVADGKVFVGTVGSSSGYLYCLDAANGSWQWRFTASGNVSGSATVVDGKVYFGCWDGYVYCLDAATGNQIWIFDAGYDVWTTPAIVGDRLYIGSLDFWCLPVDDPNADGTIEPDEIIWTYELPDVTYSSAAVVDDLVYFGCDDNKVYCLDAEGNGDGTTNLEWTYTTNGVVRSSPGLWENFYLYVGSNDGRIYCLQSWDGGFVWAHQTDSQVRCSPAVADEKVYFTAIANDFNLYCLEADDGTLVWLDDTHSYQECSPSVWDGKLYAGTYDEKLLCFGDELYSDSSTMSVDGGIVVFELDPGLTYAGRDYVLLSGVTGTDPGFDLFLTHVPLNWDPWTQTVLGLANSAMFPGFLGTFDVEGRAQAQFVLPIAVPELLGLKMYFAYLTLLPRDFASNPIVIDFS